MNSVRRGRWLLPALLALAAIAAAPAQARIFHHGFGHHFHFYRHAWHPRHHRHYGFRSGRHDEALRRR